MSLTFTPFDLGPVRLKNRLVMAPMQQYRGAPDGSATAYHPLHYGRCAEGGIGLIVVESTAVASNGRLFKDDIGLYADRHVAPLRAVTDAVHAHGVPVFVQLSHGGRKSHPPPGERLLAPSALAFDGDYGVPASMTPQDIAAAVQDFADAARRAVAAGFDGLELHAAHGYLIHQFLSPLSNRRDDAYGGCGAGRARFAREVAEAVRAAVGPGFPLSLRVSASDYVESGLTPALVTEAVEALQPCGIVAVHVSSGGLLPVPPAHSRPGYQLDWARQIREACGLPVIAVGGLHRRSLIESALADGQADLIAIGRPILERPDFMTDKLASVAFDG
ncbi:oxidoreductase [Xylophilus sp. GOD-11R]|uniref:oxidoreductase n=1 Tax=Xylophilus sp. GOD-11R TaxID=3089814 RepID=UPI00298C61F1|nr:oxidoreductase [Xylophilus sp. GOD-11R]WPB55782.1 oxidoreductase [Xylophilus sp. GOD-11R]